MSGREYNNELIVNGQKQMITISVTSFGHILDVDYIHHHFTQNYITSIFYYLIVGILIPI